MFTGKIRNADTVATGIQREVFTEKTWNDDTVVTGIQREAFVKNISGEKATPKFCSGFQTVREFSC